MDKKLEKSTTNVISLFKGKKPASQGILSDDCTIHSIDEQESFDNVMRRNQENKEKLRQERLKANQSVLKSYRIKP